MRGLKEGEEGYQEARIKVLEKRVIAMAKNDCWMRAQVEQAKDQAADARRRQVDAERLVGELLRERRGEEVQWSQVPQAGTVYRPPQGSEIFAEEKAYAEGLPRTIPSRAARCAGLITTALSNASLRSTVGKTSASMSSQSVAPTARPGNVWACLMNGGAAGSRVEFA
mmetsp:Transcript_25027/g.56486  ORF Transcript_25027/g.56486 Transcript_25027/m.56486 type:complete len:168 (+) Transcript_25027:475-978(+)